MKKNILAGINALIAILMGMLGVSCHIGYNEYGTPYATFEMSGTVTDEQEQPLENIQVVHQDGWRNGNDPTRWRDCPDTLYTDADGKFYRHYSGYFPLECQKLVVNDTTGVYASDSIDTTVTYSGGDHHWYRGKGELKADFVLGKKADND